MTSEPRAKSREPVGTGTVSRAMQLLTLLADSTGSVSIKSIADQMDLPPSTVHRLLHLLRQEGFVQPASEPRQYAIGPEFYRIAARVTDLMSPSDIAKPFLERLASTFDEAVILGLYLPEQGKMSFVVRADGKQRLKYHIDLHTPTSLLWGASGKAILAWLPEDAIRAIWAAEGASPASSAPKPSLKAVQAELASIRARGFAVTSGEKLPEARGIAAPVRNARGVIASLCMTSPTSRPLSVGVEAAGDELIETANALSIALGAQPVT